MSGDIGAFLLVILSFVVTFTAARTLSKRVRRKQREREDAARRAGESRQVRRARERREQ